MTKKVEKIISSIEPNREYALAEIVRNGLMGAEKTYFVCRSIINAEQWQDKKDRLLNAEKRGSSVGTKYYIKGINLIKYLKAND